MVGAQVGSPVAVRSAVRSLAAPLLVAAACLAVWALGDRAGLPSMRLFRISYGCGVIALLSAIHFGARRWHRPWPQSLGFAIAAFTAVELLVPAWYDLQHHVLFNRLEHFTAFVLLTQTALVLARWRGEVGLGMRALCAAGLSLLGLANEVIEYLVRWGTPFFSPDTQLDLLMNSCAIALVLAWDARRAGRTPQTSAPSAPERIGRGGRSLSSTDLP